LNYERKNVFRDESKLLLTTEDEDGPLLAPQFRDDDGWNSTLVGERLLSTAASSVDLADGPVNVTMTSSMSAPVAEPESSVRLTALRPAQRLFRSSKASCASARDKSGLM